MTDPREEFCPKDEQAVAWALHALEPYEEQEVLRHLPGCAACRAAVRDAEEVLSGLGASVEQVEPPPSLRGSLLARAAETPQLPPADGARPASDTDPAPSDAPAPRRRAPDRPGIDARQPGSRPPRRFGLSLRGRRLAAAALALVGVLTVGGLAVRTAQLEQQRDAETAQAQSVTELLQELGRPGTRHALLSTEDGATVAAVLVADGQRQVFTVGMPANAADQNTYVLWGVGDGVIPLGTFDVAGTDPGRLTVGSGAEADSYTAYAISLEPGRTAPASPSSVMAQGQVEI
jgi:hypothetical protein